MRLLLAAALLVAVSVLAGRASPAAPASPLRFLHLLLNDPQPLAIWRYNAEEERWMLHFAGAPDWVSNPGSFDGGDELWIRFPVAEVPVAEVPVVGVPIAESN